MQGAKSIILQCHVKHELCHILATAFLFYNWINKTALKKSFYSIHPPEDNRNEWSYICYHVHISYICNHFIFIWARISLQESPQYYSLLHTRVENLECCFWLLCAPCFIYFPWTKCLISWEMFFFCSLI